MCGVRVAELEQIKQLVAVRFQGTLVILKNSERDAYAGQEQSEV